MRHLLSLACLLPLFALSCQQIIGVDDLKIAKKVEGAAGASGAGGSAATPTTCVAAEGECGACIAQSCCDEGLACADDPACKACAAMSTREATCAQNQKLSAYEACASARCPACF